MESYLKQLPIQIFVHEVAANTSFVAEHLEETQQIPSSFNEFIADIALSVEQSAGQFKTLGGQSEFQAYVDHNHLFVKRLNKGTYLIPNEVLWVAWSTLQVGAFSGEQFQHTSTNGIKSYLFPILGKLPYVEVTRSSTSQNKREE